MTDSHRLTDFIARIRWLGENGFYQTSQDYIDAADEIEKLMAALKPFTVESLFHDDAPTLKDYEAARAAYYGEKE